MADPIKEQKQKQLDMIRRVMSDAFAFIRSMEATKVFTALTLDDLMAEQIARNGDLLKSQSTKYSPYGSNATPSGESAIPMSNFVSGTNASNPTKLDRVLSLKTEIDTVCQQMTAMEIDDIAEVEDYAEANLDNLEE